jgi:hypothetical protein
MTTNNTYSDTDGDGTTDDQEDIDGDGTDDGKETYTLTVENSTLGVSIDITGEGNVARGLTIQQATQNATDDGRADHAVRINNQRSFDYAEVTYELDTDITAENVTLRKWSTRTNASLRSINASVYGSNNTIVANVTSFSSLHPMYTQTAGGGNPITTEVEMKKGWPQFDDMESGGWTTGGDVTYNNSELVIDHNTSISDAGSWAERSIELDDFEAVGVMGGGSVSAGSWGYAKVYIVNSTDPGTEAFWNSSNRKVLASAYGDPDGGESDGIGQKNITEWAGEEVMVRAVAYGDADVNIDWLRFERHSDRDRISDAVENAASKLEQPALVFENKKFGRVETRNSDCV